jgi:hypothetical protein
MRGGQSMIPRETTSDTTRTLVQSLAATWLKQSVLHESYWALHHSTGHGQLSPECDVGENAIHTLGTGFHEALVNGEVLALVLVLVLGDDGSERREGDEHDVLTHCEMENWIFCWLQKKELMLEDGWLLQNVAGEGELEGNTSSRSGICCWRWKKVGKSSDSPRRNRESNSGAAASKTHAGFPSSKWASRLGRLGAS